MTDFENDKNGYKIAAKHVKIKHHYQHVLVMFKICLFRHS